MLSDGKCAYTVRSRLCGATFLPLSIQDSEKLHDLNMPDPQSGCHGMEGTGGTLLLESGLGIGL